jgi:hypothetical protein
MLTTISTAPLVDRSGCQTNSPGASEVGSAAGSATTGAVAGMETGAATVGSTGVSGTVTDGVNSAASTAWVGAGVLSAAGETIMVERVNATKVVPKRIFNLPRDGAAFRPVRSVECLFRAVGFPSSFDLPIIPMRSHIVFPACVMTGPRKVSWSAIRHVSERL